MSTDSKHPGLLVSARAQPKCGPRGAACLQDTAQTVSSGGRHWHASSTAADCPSTITNGSTTSAAHCKWAQKMAFCGLVADRPERGRHHESGSVGKAQWARPMCLSARRATASAGAPGQINQRAVALSLGARSYLILGSCPGCQHGFAGRLHSRSSAAKDETATFRTRRAEGVGKRAMM